MGTEPKPGTSTVHRVLVELRDSRVDIAVSGEPDAVAALIERLRPGACPRRPVRPFAVLTPHEVVVATLVGQALTNQQIASRLNISTHTVNFHLRQIFRKLALPSRVHLAMLARADDEGHDGDRRD
jgi:DNA-binding CsgD family transcriptional regulator